jgi:hypothetical protein
MTGGPALAVTVVDTPAMTGVDALAMTGVAALAMTGVAALVMAGRRNGHDACAPAAVP